MKHWAVAAAGCFLIAVLIGVALVISPPPSLRCDMVNVPCPPMTKADRVELAWSRLATPFTAIILALALLALRVLLPQTSNDHPIGHTGWEMSDLSPAEMKFLADSQAYDPANARLGAFRFVLALGLLAGALNVTRGLLGLFGIGHGDLGNVSEGLVMAALFFLMYSSVRDRTVAFSLVRKLVAKSEYTEQPSNGSQSQLPTSR